MTPPHSARTEPDADGQEGPGARKHPLTAAEKQAAELAQLMKHPEKLAPVPAPKPELPTLRPPKDIIKNVSGSSAGAGSGDFHVYKHARRREYERVHIMEMADQKVCATPALQRRPLEADVKPVTPRIEVEN